jgi:hypothetical protein
VRGELPMRTRPGCWLAGALIACALFAGPGRAEPSPPNWTTPSCITLVGSHGGVPATAYGQFTLTARDLANNPLVGVTTVLDLSACLDLEICADQLDPDAIVNCAAKTVTKLTGANGQVTFTVLGCGNGRPASTLLNGGRIYGDGVLVASPSVSTFDLDGSGGVNGNDMSLWLGDFFTGQVLRRSDYDCSGGVGANDLSMWFGAFGSGTMVESCASHCP